MTSSSSSTVDIQAIAGAVAASVQQALQTQSSSTQSQEENRPTAPQGRLEVAKVCPR